MYYINMGASQFLRDFRKGSLIKKSAELRKRVLQRQEKTKEKSDSVPFKVGQTTVTLLVYFLSICNFILYISTYIYIYLELCFRIK